MVLGRKTYEGLAAVWPQLVDDPTLGLFAERLNSMPKYVASRTLREPLAWNATLLEGDLAESVRAQGAARPADRVWRRRAGPCPHRRGLVDEFWFWVSPYLWHAGPRIFDGVGPVRLQLIGSTTFPSGCCGCPTGPHLIGRIVHPVEATDAASAAVWLVGRWLLVPHGTGRPMTTPFDYDRDLQRFRLGA